jgi:hypothetical protein
MLMTLYIFGALLQFFIQRNVYWDIDSEGLHRRNLRSKKEFSITWDKVLVVRNMIPGLRIDGTVAVYYDNPGSKLGFKYIVAKPKDRKQFIVALRSFAPQAKFTIK